MKVQYFKDRERMPPVDVTHATHRYMRGYALGQGKDMHHNTLRLTIKNQANAEAIALMLANAEGVHDGK